MSWRLGTQTPFGKKTQIKTAVKKSQGVRKLLEMLYTHNQNDIINNSTYIYVQSTGAAEYADCTSAEG